MALRLGALGRTNSAVRLHGVGRRAAMAREWAALSIKLPLLQRCRGAFAFCCVTLQTPLRKRLDACRRCRRV